MEQHGGIVEERGTVWWNSVERCGGTEQQWNSVVQQCERCATVWWNIGTVLWNSGTVWWKRGAVWNSVVEHWKSMVEQRNSVVKQCGLNNMVEQCGTVFWNGGTVWWNSVAEQCGGTM